MRKARRSRSSIKRLPPDLKAEIDRLLLEGKLTLTEITDQLHARGASVSRSAVHRYSQYHEQMAADIRATREMARAIGQELEDVEGDSGRLVIESIQSLLFRAWSQLAESDEINPKDLGELTRSAKDLQHALKLNVETEVKIRDRVLKDAAEAAGSAAGKEGLSAGTIENIKATILGLGRAA